MSLQKSYKTVSLAGGIDTKTDPKQVQPPHTLITDNGYYTTNGMVRKRNGYAQVDGTSFGYYATIFAPGSELLVNTQDTLYGWNTTTSTWQNKGANATANVALRTDYAPLTSAPFYGLSCAQNGNYNCYAWQSDNGYTVGTTMGVAYYGGSGMYGIQDKNTGAWVLPPRALPTTVPAASGGLTSIQGATNPVVVAFGSYFYVFYLAFGPDGGAINHLLLAAFTINATTFATSGATTIQDIASPISTTNAAAAFDVCSDAGAGKIWATVAGAASAQVNIFATPGSFTVTTATLPAAFKVATNRLTTCYTGTYLAVYRPAGGQFVLMNGSTNAFGTVKITVTASESIPASMCANGNLVAIAVGQGTAPTCYVGCVVATITGISTIAFSAVTGQLNNGGHAVAAPLSKPFVDPATGSFYCWIGDTGTQNGSFTSPLVAYQPVGHLVNMITGQPLARIQYLQQGGVGQGLQVPGVLGVPTASPGLNRAGTFPTVQNTAFMAGPGYVGAALATSVTLQTAVITVTFYLAGSVTALPFGSAAVLGSTIPAYYDGAAVYQQGFDQAPELPVPTQAATGSMTSGNTYKYIAVYRRFDAYGNEHWGPPSLPRPVTLTAGNTAVQFASTLNQYMPTGCDMVIFRQNSSTADLNYYELGPIELFQTVPADKAADTAITSGRTIYCDGTSATEVQNDPPPAFTQVVGTKTRFFGVSAEFPNRVYYTKPFKLGRGPEWNAGQQYILVDVSTGPITALAAVDEKVVIFKASTAYYFYGDGPDATGAGSFSALVQIPLDTGCSNPNSVCVTDQGVFYQTVRGIMLLPRSLGASIFVGAPVQGYVGTIMNAVVVPVFNQVRFAISGASVTHLVYDYVSQRWSTFSGANIFATTACMWNGTYAIYTAGSSVFYETGFLDIVQAITLTIQTPWIEIAGPQGYGRLYRFLLLGDYKSTHTLQVRIYYDYNTGSSDVITYTHNPADPVYQFRARAPRQVMQVASMVFTDTSSSGESYDISNLVLEVGVKSGAAKLPAAKSV